MESVRLVSAAIYPWIAAILTLLLTTTRKRGQNLLDALRSDASASPLRVAGIAH
jgi:hypothetical protein